MDLPTPSGWIFYLSNLIIVSGYLMASALITRRKSLAQGMSWSAWLAGLSFFLLCGLTHLELAIHSYFNLRLINTDGTVDWHVLAVHIPQGISIWTFLITLQREGQGAAPGAPPPLEGIAGDQPPQEDST